MTLRKDDAALYGLTLRKERWEMITMQETTRKSKNKGQKRTKNAKTVKKIEQKEEIRKEYSPESKIKRTPGRPPRMTTKALIAAAYDYMESSPMPNITEFALLQGYERQYLYERADNEKNKGKPQLSDTLKKISQLKEVQLEKMAIMGLCPPNFAIFALKQLGWTDTVEQKIDADVDAEVSGVVLLAPVLESNHEPEPES